MKLIIANWKMNPASVAEAIELAKATDYDNLVICPPFPFLKAVKEVIKKSQLGAQDLFWENPTGPYTGEVSAAELKNIGVQYVIIGHSERRKNLGETNEVIARKIVAAIKEGLVPILCVGETWEQKMADEKKMVISDQIRIGLSLLPQLEIENWKLKTYIAYEPVWAISTNPNAQADTPEETLAVIFFIKDFLLQLEYRSPVSFLYGGSVSAANADSFLRHPKIAGALVGGASLKQEEMGKVIAIAAKYE